MSTEKAELTADQKRALFEGYEKQRSKVAAAANALDIAVRAIASELGHGPFRWQGVQMTIVKRGERLLVRRAGEVEEIG